MTHNIRNFLWAPHPLQEQQRRRFFQCQFFNDFQKPVLPSHSHPTQRRRKKNPVQSVIGKEMNSAFLETNTTTTFFVKTQQQSADNIFWGEHNDTLLKSSLGLCIPKCSTKKSKDFAPHSFLDIVPSTESHITNACDNRDTCGNRTITTDSAQQPCPTDWLQVISQWRIQPPHKHNGSCVTAIRDIITK